MDWRELHDEFGQQLELAYETVLANLTDPYRAIEPFEPILEELKYHAALPQKGFQRIQLLGRELFERLRSCPKPVAMELRHYSWHLQHLGDSGSSSLTDMFMITLTRFAHYKGHQVEKCQICAEFPLDLPFQGSSDGRKHFHKWLMRGRQQKPSAM